MRITFQSDGRNQRQQVRFWSVALQLATMADRDNSRDTTSTRSNGDGADRRQSMKRRTSSLSQHPPTGADWEACRYPSTLSPSGPADPTQQQQQHKPPSAAATVPKLKVAHEPWDYHPSHAAHPVRNYVQRNLGWHVACLLGRDGFLAASLAANPRGDALPQFWMLQRGVVVFLAISFNACLSQALRYEPTAEEIYSLDLWRASTALFTLGAMSALNSVGAFAWVGIAFANVPKSQFPSFVSKNGAAFRALNFTHFVAFTTALLGTFVRVLAEHPFWTEVSWSSRIIGISAVLGMCIFVYGLTALLNLFSVTVCDQNGFDSQLWPGLCENTNTTLQRHQAQMAKEEQAVAASVDTSSHIPEVQFALSQMDSLELAKWLLSDEKLAPLHKVAIRESIEGSALLEMASMTAAEASVYYASLFPTCPRGLGITLWRTIKYGR